MRVSSRRIDRLAVANLLPGDSRKVQGAASVPDLADGTSITNRVEVIYAGVPSPVQAERAGVVERTPPMTLEIIANRDPVVPGEPYSYTLTYGNRDTAPEAGIVLKMALPSGVSFVRASDGGALLGEVVQ
jgi:uncharacterized repeat protein (TIGR01451 family)